MYVTMYSFCIYPNRWNVSIKNMFKVQVFSSFYFTSQEFVATAIGLWVFLMSSIFMAITLYFWVTGYVVWM